MGVTKGGILVPSPLSYDYDTIGTGVAGSLTCSASSVIRIVTRVPCNARIDDFEAFYAMLRVSPALGYITFTIKVTNLRTSQVLSTSSHTVLAPIFTPHRYDISKGNELLPGDPIEVLITRTIGDELRMMAWQNGAFFSSAVVGQAFPSASDSFQRFTTPAMFFSWLDSDDAVLVEWMPGLLPASALHYSTTAARAFVGNLITMPFADRRPSGIWLRQNGGTARFKASIYREPTGSSDFTEMYSILYPDEYPGFVWYRILYLPFDGAQPILERGKRYVVGVGDAVGPQYSGSVYYSEWIGSSFPSPLDPVHSGFSLLAEAREVVPSGAWIATARKRFEVGLVFEESET